MMSIFIDPFLLYLPFLKCLSHQCERLNDYFLTNELLHCKQYGFRKNSTTELAVNQIVEELIEAGEKKKDKLFCGFRSRKSF